MSMFTMGNVVTGERCSIEPGTGNYHLDGAHCDDCDTRHLITRSLGEVEDMYREGRIRQVLFEAYMHVWANGAPRFSSLGNQWMEPPTDPKVAGLVELLRKAAVR